MKKVLYLLERFIGPYKKYMWLSLLFNLLSTVFSLFSFAALIPVLQILFGLKKAQVQYMEWSSNQPFTEILEALKNNVEYSIEQMVVQSGPETALLYLGLFLVVMTAFKTGTAYMGTVMSVPIRIGVVRDLRNKLYKKIVSLPIGFFSDERKGDIMARMTGDVTEVELSMISSVDVIFKHPIMITVYLGVLFAMSWQLTLFVLVLLPISGWLIGIVGKNLKKQSLVAQNLQGELLSQLDETIGGLRIIKAFNAQKKAENRFGGLNENIRSLFYKLHNRYNLAFPLSEFIGTVVIALLLWFGGLMIVGNHSQINAAEFIYYLVIFYSIITPAKDLSRATFSIRKGLASLERIDRIMDAEDTIQEPANPVHIDKFEHQIEFNNVSFRYQQEWVLQDIQLTIPRGKTVALVGQSGSGKTTLIDLLPRFYDPEKGEILIDGINIKNINTLNLRQFMGNVNQEAILFNDTFYNNITFGVDHATREQVEEAAKIANAHDFIMETELGYETNIGDRGSKLSGGQRQRISIARAILKNPPILILDEATSALDTASEKMVQKALENLMANRTTLVVAHRLSTIRKADEICVLHEGKIVERGRHDELIALNGYYKRLVDMQSF